MCFAPSEITSQVGLDVVGRCNVGKSIIMGKPKKDYMQKAPNKGKSDSSDE